MLRKVVSGTSEVVVAHDLAQRLPRHGCVLCDLRLLLPLPARGDLAILDGFVVGAEEKEAVGRDLDAAAPFITSLVLPCAMLD